MPSPPPPPPPPPWEFEAAAAAIVLARSPTQLPIEAFAVASQAAGPEERSWGRFDERSGYMRSEAESPGRPWED
jgi:hypothetical protein